MFGSASLWNKQYESPQVRRHQRFYLHFYTVHVGLYRISLNEINYIHDALKSIYNFNLFKTELKKYLVSTMESCSGVLDTISCYHHLL